MKDPRYKFTITVSAHVLLLNENKVLMAKRPDNWEWGPGRWGVVGGKVYEKESFFDCVKRKTLQEMGFEVSPEGLYHIKQLIIADKQAFMFFFVSHYHGEKIKGEMKDYKWFGKEDLDKTDAREFTEYFYQEMLGKLLNEPLKTLPIEMVESLNYIKMSKAESYKYWFDGMINENYNPDVISDYQNWKKNIKKN